MSLVANFIYCFIDLAIGWCYSYLFKQNYCGGTAIIFTNFIALQAPEPAPSGSSIFDLFLHSSAPAFVILLLLALFSLLSWTIIFRKWLTFRHISRQSRAFIEFFRKSARLSEVESAGGYYRGTPLSGVFSAGYQELNAQIQTLKPQNVDRPVLLERNITGIQRALQRASAAELSVLEKGMSWLATTGSVSPFIGLLGTVIGIINAFNGLGLVKTASIQAVAPGISEALIATAAGLFAAIPAVIAYNQFISRIKNIAVEMDDFSSEFLNLVERSFS
jgi:biopolymer transport protein TolQ